ncbi:hypothetical protein J4526_03785 [Desulfurococcaceae archaeon MEX13E-LK6-19]|nr:hypothetical protein J4526_03785 [Desulfurococcaceae archaeon MEX13E-LK6-19]
MNFISFLASISSILTILFLLLYSVSGKYTNIIKKGVSNLDYGKKYLLIINIFLMILLIIASIKSIIYRPNYWYYIYVLITNTLFIYYLLSLVNESKIHKSYFLLTIQIVVFSLVILTTFNVVGWVPITSDEGRYIGYAYRIVKEHKWFPYKYPEHEYYQPFHVIPYLRAVFSLITCLPIETIAHVLFVLCINIIFMMLIYILSKRISNNIIIALLSMALFYVSPATSVINFIPRVLSNMLFFTMVTVLLKKDIKIEVNDLIVLLIIIISGTLIHPTFSLLSGLFIVIFIVFINHNKKRIFHIILIMFVFITLTYWLITAGLIITVKSSRNFFYGLVSIFNVLSGESTQNITSGIREPHYSRAPLHLAYSWAFLPAISAAFLLSKLMRLDKKKNLYGNFFGALSFVSISLIILGYAIRFTSEQSVYIGYPSYLLALLVAINYVYRLWRKGFMNIILFIILLSVGVNVAILDPSYSPDVYNLVPIPDNTYWNIGKSLSFLITGEYTKQVDREIRLGLNAYIIANKPQLFEFYNVRIKSKQILYVKVYGKNEYCCDLKFNILVYNCLKVIVLLN